MAISLLYVTTKDIEEARRISLTLLDRNLIACANILPQMESIYRWKGEIESSQECILVLKTVRAKVEETTAAVIELHSYETPCVLEIPVGHAAEGYMNWINGEVTSTR
ncbi:MAG TPA: divalent-cation tolerance protein CutA [Bdellovibrionales bacterium]|nr:divalent-cation tolerance protein CutA [Bdellovibrionales bacterium]